MLVYLFIHAIALSAVYSETLMSYLSLLRQMVHLHVSLCVPFLITFEMAMWTFYAATLVY